ncbi:MAG: formate dehydrogenase accessory sulfurtransferase FdhD [Myxococcota bacterium]|nr:formate dehydrogenase accessory sulfurtransferase FdhD [Myxococcota bacterium]
MAVERIRQIQRYSAQGNQEPQLSTDQVAIEEPLEIQLDGDPLAVIMRTPGNDLELVVGLLLTEELIQNSDDLLMLEHCRDPEEPNAGNIVKVKLSESCLKRIQENNNTDRMKRTFLTSTSCGVCGKQSIESLHASTPPFSKYDSTCIEDVVLFSEKMKTHQTLFDKTGGIHAAALFDKSGELLLLREDVGRHNAVDKCIGSLVLTEQLPLENCSLMVSGRTSFEIVQKALVARIGTVGAVSAPSSLAVELARESRINLFGFVRGNGLNIYASERLENQA